ncbi:AI-2E family transporter [Terrimonas sp. NA20]|uniref:AI-2E family transporter n=1 Tax=Terrimonas ginsenosidimutans TaxID=2908004 RepID=A0ABS9KMA1_9BACT|nr:AI-2E family transporter [Terrimonas ginsenosidimutans]MCG2613453.1 AI-2E family transporter [Terrimonas ginsenosidimutans]
MTPSPTPTNNSIAREVSYRLFNLLAIVSILYLLRTVIVPLLFSLILSISLFPIARRMEKWKMGKALAAAIAVILGSVIGGLIIWLFFRQMVSISADNGEAITARVVEGIDDIIQWITAQFGVQQGELLAKVQAEAGKLASGAAAYSAGLLGSLGGILANAVLIPIFIFFQLYYRDFFIEFFFKAFRHVSHEKVHDTLQKIYRVVQDYLLGLVTVMGIVAVLNTIGLLVMGIEYAWFFGILASLLLLIPYIGIAIGSILPALFALATKDSAWYALGIIGWFQVVQFLEGNFITPYIVGGKVSVNPLLAIIGLLLGGLLFGLAGLILAIPMVAIVKVVLDAGEKTEPYGFLIGEPESYHLKKTSRRLLLMKWKRSGN